jgi:putative heme-binding domain-containing protein
VRENAVRIAERHLTRSPSLVPALLRLAGDPDPKVRFQLLLTLGDVATGEAAAVRERLLWDHVEDAWMQTAALSARDADPAALIGEAVTRLGGAETAGRRDLFARLAAMSAASGRADRIRHVITRALDRGTASSWWRGALLEGLATGLRGLTGRNAELDAERALLAKHLLDPSTGSTRRPALAVLEALGPAPGSAEALRQQATSVVANPASDPEARADAIRLLALGGVKASEGVLRTVLASPNPAAVQIAAVRALAEPRGDEVAGVFLDLWDRWTPAVRDEAVRALVREPGRIRRLVDALADGRVKVSEIEWPLRVRMMMVEDAELRARARTLLSAPAGAAKAAMARYDGIDRREADAARGREVFDRTCAICHRYRGAGGAAFGPDLGEVRGRLPHALLSDIVQPNLSIADGYELWIAELTDGSTVSGTVGAETASSLTFRQAGGADVTVARARMSSLRIAPMSGMPEGLDSQLTVQEMADLIAYIRGGR